MERLFGVNALKIMALYQIISSQGNGPYAVETLLGWVVKSPLNASTAMDDEGTAALVNQISIVHLEKRLEKQYAHDLQRKSKKRKGRCRSCRLHQVLLLSKTVPLLFYDWNVIMPNNYQMAEQ